MITTRTRFWFVPFIVWWVAPLISPAHGQTDSFHILLTNDDGIESPGIQVLAEKLREVGQVHVIAPCGQRSGSSMSVTIGQELLVRRITRDGRDLGQCVNTTPASTVLLALTTLAPEGGFDLVVSGINRGANVGTASHLSGTVGAAMMGAFNGVPAVAASLGTPATDFDYAARFVAAFVAEMRQRPPMPGVVLSINVPRQTEGEIAGVAVAQMGGIHLHFEYEELPGGSDERRFRPIVGPETQFPPDSDTEAFMGDMITVTPLLFDWTAYAALGHLRGWGLSHQVGR